MIQRLVLAVVVAVAVILVCLLLGYLLGATDLEVTEAIGEFLKKFAALIGILAGIWYYLRGGVAG